MVNLLELAPAILVQLAITREDMQLLEQLNGLVGFNFGDICHIDILRQKTNQSINSDKNLNQGMEC